MKTYVCPEFAATGIELQIIELQVRREQALEHRAMAEVAAFDEEITSLWAQLAELADHLPESPAPTAA